MIRFYFSEAFKSLKREKGSALITIFTIVIAIIITTFSIISLFLSKEFNESIVEKFSISLFLEDKIANQTQNNIKDELNNKNWISSITFIDKESAMKDFIKETGEDFSILLNINPLPESFKIKINSKDFNLNNLELKINELRKIQGVDDVIYDYEYVIKFIKFINSLQIFLIAFSFLTILLSVYLIYSTNKLIYKSRVELYNIMKLVGAKLSTIKIPIYLNGLLLGMISGTFCIILMNFFAFGLTNLFNIVNFTKLIILINAIIPLLGILFGVLGGIFSTKNINLKIERG